MKPDDWTPFRDQFPVTEQYAYFQHPAVSALPRAAFEVLTERAREMMDHGCLHERDWVQEIEEIRSRVARLLGTSPDRIGFVHNTSHGLSLIAESFPWNRGDSVAVPESEFPANVYPWMNQRRKGVSFRWIPVPEEGLRLDQVRQTVDETTRILALSSVQFHNGFRSDLRSMAAFCQRQQIHLVVDAIQSLGWDPLDVESIPVAAVVADGHKWLCGPEGAGLCYLEESFQSILNVSSVGWKSVNNPFDFDRIQFDLKQDAAVVEEGSPNTLGILALGASLRLLLRIGVQNIRERTLQLCEEAAQHLATRGFELPRREWETVHCSPILVAKHDDIPAAKLVDYAGRNGVQTSLRGGRLRAGFHFYNNREDLRKLVECIDTYRSQVDPE